MHDVMGTVYLEWSPTRSGVVVRKEGRKGRQVRVDDVPAAIESAGDVVVVRHIDGSALVSAAMTAVTSGAARLAQVESDFGHRTDLTGTAVRTLDAWITFDPSVHPAARVLAYGSGDPRCAAAVIGNLFDPRWYRDDDRPDRNAAAEARMGLTPRWDHKDSVFRKCLTAAWAVEHHKHPTDADFFGRMYNRVLGYRRDPAAAERVVGRYFLKCALAAWVDADRPKGAEPMFDPGLLFDSRAVTAVKRGT